jgi:hypothetical protein
MPANVEPIFSKQGNTGCVARWLPATTANTKSDGVGTIATDMLLAFTAGANGAKIDRIRLAPAASAAATATTATVARFYISSVTSGATTNLNTFMFAEVACPAQTADQTATATNYIEIPCGFVLPAGWTILMSMHHAAAANTSWGAIVFGGDY